MKPNLSEFSYGYAVTDELIHWHNLPITASPIFPSLYQEGQSGGGYDVRLERGGLPLFLQFKLSDWMVRRTAREAQTGQMSVPYYRMQLRPRRHSAQQEMLLNLENDGHEVYYVAPAFHEPSQLNDAYRERKVVARSIWMRPSFIGPLRDDDDHCVAFYNPRQTAVFCSEPRKINSPVDFDSVSERTIAELKERGEIALQLHNLHRLAETLQTIALKKLEIQQQETSYTVEEMKRRNPIEQIAFFAQIFLNAQFYVVQYRDIVA